MSIISKTKGINRNLLSEGEKIIIGLSGGPDSVFLTYMLDELKDIMNLSLRLAHVNYKLRGIESDEDEQFCCNLASKFNFPIDVKTSDLSGFKKSPGNIQANAREERMRFFEELLSKHNYDKFALGTIRDDNAETILGNIIRGCGLSGLSGIEAQTGKIIRPILKVGKTEIIACLKENDIIYRTDSSNAGLDYTRNKIRNSVIPMLSADFNPQLDKALIRLASLSGEAVLYFEDYVKTFLDKHVISSLLRNAIVPLTPFNEQEIIVRRYILKAIIETLSDKSRDHTSYDLIDSALDIPGSPTGTRADLGGGLMIEKGSDCLVVFRPSIEIEAQKIDIPGKIALQGYELELNSLMVETNYEDWRKSNNWSVYLDLDKLGADLYVRRFEDGDYFQPLGMSNSRKLGDYFTDRKIPRAIRAEIPLLFSGEMIAWVMGEGVSECFKIDGSTRRVMKLWLENVVKNVE
jgi:tRNA(Ile)-lysidine synthase